MRSEEERVGWGVLERASAVQVAAVVEGRPLLRTLHGVVHEGSLCFHGGRRGEKAELPGARVVAGAEEIVARIPSWMIEPERACPATTFFRSVQAEGTLEEVEDLGEKAALLEALMVRFQREGGYRTIRAEDPMYTRSVAGTRVLRLRPERLMTRVKLGQNKPPEVRLRILQGLWRRGEPGDLAAIEAICDAAPGTPPLFALPEGLRLVTSPDPDIDLPQVVALLRGAYWLEGVAEDRTAEAHRSSTAWMVIRAGTEVAATARAVSDTSRRSWIYDVCVQPARRGQGLGRALVEALLDHPALRRTAVLLGTRDAQRFYAGLGFVAWEDLPPRPFPTTQMLRAPRSG